MMQPHELRIGNWITVMGSIPTQVTAHYLYMMETNTTKPDLSKIKLERSMETAKDILKTSAEWQALHPNPVVMDPDGWDRKNYQYSWFEEKITYTEYQKRMLTSTCMYNVQPPNRDKELWSAASIILELFNAQQEYTQQDWYDWLKEFTEKREREIADKAWEAGSDIGIIGLKNIWSDDRFEAQKKSFMKSLFPLKEI